MLTEQVRVLAEKVILPIGNAATQLPRIKMVGFSAMHGSIYDGGLMVVGRAVNSFRRERFPEEFSGLDNAMAFAQKVVDDSNIKANCPMGWLNEAWAGEVEYKARRSTFWRAINAVMQGLELTTENDENWASKLVVSQRRTDRCLAYLVRLLRRPLPSEDKDARHKIPSESVKSRDRATGRHAAQGKERCTRANASANFAEGSVWLQGCRNHERAGSICRHGRQDPAKMC